MTTQKMKPVAGEHFARDYERGDESAQTKPDVLELAGPAYDTASLDATRMPEVEADQEKLIQEEFLAAEEQARIREAEDDQIVEEAAAEHQA